MIYLTTLKKTQFVSSVTLSDNQLSKLTPLLKFVLRKCNGKCVCYYTVKYIDINVYLFMLQCYSDIDEMFVMVTSKKQQQTHLQDTRH